MYAHVASKEDVLWSIVDAAATAFEDAADAALADASSDPIDRLAALVEAHVEVVTADPQRSSVFVTEWRHLSVRPQFSEILRAAPDDVDPDLDVDEVFDLVEGAVLARILVPAVAAAGRGIDSTAEMIVRVLAPVGGT